MPQDMEKHVRILSKMMVVLGIFYLVLLVLVGVFGLWAVNNQMQNSEIDVEILPTVLTGAIIALPMVLLGVFHILTGRAFQRKAKWARIAMWILAVINLGNVPLGTALGAYGIWVLVKTREDVKAIPE
jgi:uncharacterized membrane protein YozB (DUF420 family)